MKSVTIRCFAKVNLTLEIIGRRDDGYHDLATIFQSISLADELKIEPGGPSRHPTTTIIGSPAPVGMDLCDRAVDAFRACYGWPDDVTVKLHKHIPVGAGLGGGSVDAAGTLLGLAVLHGEADRQGLAALAAEIGSDVAFFLEGGTALGSGRGEELEPLPPVTEGFLVVARPELRISTREAYGLLQPVHYSDGARTTALAGLVRRGCGLREVAPYLYNGFAPVVEERWAETRALRERFVSFGARGALLSGSGAAVFGVFGDQASATQAAAELQREGLWAEMARPVARGLEVADECDE